MNDQRRMRIFVGDVHGCSAELDDLLERLQPDPQRHRLCFTGDLVNRGPDSLGVLRRVRELDATVVLGNHDLHLLGRAMGIRRPRRGDTLEELLAAPDHSSLLGWLRQRPLIEVWDDVVMVHAGLHPRWGDPAAVGARLRTIVASRPDPLKDHDVSFAVAVRTCDARGWRPERTGRGGDPPDPPYAPWDSWYLGEPTVVFGHWAQRGLVIGDRVRGLDTGCVYGGSLTAWIADDDRFVSVPAREQYVVPGAD